MSLFRRVDLPADVPGALYLHSLPGRHEPLDACWREARRLALAAVVCLVPDDEILALSPEYHAALARAATPCEVWRFAIVDFGTPDDRDGFARLLARAAERLRSGDALLVHCAAGIGRTGMFAAGVLRRLGLDSATAAARVRAAGSWAERPEQADALDALAEPDDS